MTAPTYEKIQAPTAGTRVTYTGGKWTVPNDPVVVLLKGDGIGADVNGVPGITIPKTAAPTEEKIAVLKKGDGAVVAKGATVTVHYTGALWSDNSIFDSSWTKGSPASFSLAQVVPGFAQAIEGQTVGSQVIAVIPPALGYGDKASGAIPAGSTLVFVIDILATN